MSRSRLPSASENEKREAVKALTEDKSVAYVADMILLEDKKFFDFLASHQIEVPVLYRKTKEFFENNENQKDKNPQKRSYNNSYNDILFEEKNQVGLKKFAALFAEFVGKEFENYDEEREWQEALNRAEQASSAKSRRS